MSSSREEASRRISYREAVERIASDMGRVEEYIKALQQNASLVVAELDELRIAREALEQLKSYKGEEALLALDRRGHVMARGIVTSKEKVIANIGGDFHMELPIDDALKIISLREGDLRNALNTINQEIAEAYALYERLRESLSKLVEEAGKRVQAGTG